MELSSLSDRANEAITQSLFLTHDIIQEQMEKIRANMESLFLLTDSIALLDMVISFADLVALSSSVYSRPVLKDDGPMLLKSARHPTASISLLQQISSTFIPNDFYINEIENFLVITGPNGSGKTMYLKQVALITIMAQIGCFIPAKYGVIPIRSKILSRLGTNDDMEHNLSTFATEMKDISYLMSNANKRSLVIIDELGRGTSSIDGTLFQHSQLHCFYI